MLYISVCSRKFSQDLLYFKMRQISRRQTSRSKSHLKLLELLLGSSSLCHFKDVKSHCLAEGSALPDSHNVSNCDVSAEDKTNKETKGNLRWVCMSKNKLTENVVILKRSCISFCQRQCRQSFLSLEDHREKKHHMQQNKML